MKKVITVLFSALVIGLVSCNKEDNSPSAAINGPWELVKSVSSWTGTVVEGENLTYTEKYQFNPDGSFSKTTTRGDLTSVLPRQGLGKFTIVPNTEEDQLMNLNLVFETGTDIAGTCVANKENLFISTNYQLINSSWAPCDGPTLFYERKPATR